MSDVLPELLRREAAVNATMRKYRHRAWSWADAVTCVHMARFHLRKLGHRVEPMPRVRSLVAAKRALAERGWQDVADMLDAQPGLMRIPPAMMLPGDLTTVPSADGLGSIYICAGPHKLMGWHDGAADFGVKGMVLVDVPLDQLSGAWSAKP